ncbi:MAG: transcription antitermination protein NusB [Muribaculaceae bacterium]|nr:transcription antitermination protein NusB [Muribaculaceae bacterium]
MLNRTLIRIKVVQQLYAYMLTRHDFTIDPAPQNPSRDKLATYNAYRDVLLMIFDLSGYPVNGRSIDLGSGAQKRAALHSNKLAMALRDDSSFRAELARDNDRIGLYDEVLPAVLDEIIASRAYADYVKLKEHTVDSDCRFWETILMTTLMNSKTLHSFLRRVDGNNFTVTGYRHGISQAAQTIADFRNSDNGLASARLSLQRGLNEAYALYNALLRLIVDLTAERRERIEMARNKYLPSAEDLNPDMRLASNRLAAHLEEQPEIEEALKDGEFSWVNNPATLRVLLDKIMESDIYREYVDAEKDDFETDAEFWRQVMRNIILPSDELAETLEDSSIYWNGDLEVIGSFVLKTLKQFATRGPETMLLPQYKDDEDKAFGPRLFNAAIKHKEEYRGYIDRFVNKSQWDSDRLALMDIVIMITAITEIIDYPLIPIAVSLNEYINVAHVYSTERSGNFINGILYSIVNHLIEEGVINKPLPAKER